MRVTGSTTTPSDDGGLARMQHARRNEPEGEPLAVDDHRMAGVVTTLIADDDIGFGREKVDQLRLALVTPLRSEHNSSWHGAQHYRPRTTAVGRIRWADASLADPHARSATNCAAVNQARAGGSGPFRWIRPCGELSNGELGLLSEGVVSFSAIDDQHQPGADQQQENGNSGIGA